jgi:hypothetical protein
VILQDAAARFLGGSALGMWKRLGPYMYAEREAGGRGVTYQRYFEALAKRISEMDLEGEIDKLPKAPARIAHTRVAHMRRSGVPRWPRARTTSASIPRYARRTAVTRVHHFAQVVRAQFAGAAGS